MFELRIWPGPGLSSGATSSSPVASTAHRGFASTRIRVRPIAARAPISAARIRWPGRSTTSPVRMSVARRAMFCPGFTGDCSVTRVPSRDVFSTCWTASAPEGTGAPVMIFVHVPGPTSRAGTFPAGTSSITSSGPASADRTA